MTVTASTAGKAGINVTGDNSFTVYGQANDTGKLVAKGNLIGNNRGAGIGGNGGEGGSNITIYGGTVEATGIMYAAGIGGGKNGSANNIAIFGGKVTASGGSSGGAGIGSGSNGSASNIIIYGGKVTASGIYGIGGSNASNIKVTAGLTVKAGSNANSTAVVVNDNPGTSDLASSLSAAQYVKIAPVVCAVGSVSGTKYFSIADALAADHNDENATTPTVIYLIGNDTENVTIDNGRTITLDLNGHVLKADLSDSQNHSVITNNGTLTITDSNPTAEYKYVVGEYGLWTWNDSAEGTAKAYESLTARPTVAEVIAVKGGCITGGTGGSNSSDHNGNGGGVANNGTLTISGGNVVGNTTPSHGGGIYNYNNGALTISGGNVIGNKAGSGSGGGTYNFGSGTLMTIRSGEIAFNTAKTGGGVSTNEHVNVSMAGGVIFGNYASTVGGGVYNVGTFTMTGGTITGNSAKSVGGGVNNDSKGTMTVGGTAKITGNTVGTTNSTISNLYLPSGKTVTISSVTALTSGASIGATLASGTGAFTSNGTSADAAFFTSDSDAYMVEFNNNGTESEADDYLELINMPACQVEIYNGSTTKCDSIEEALTVQNSNENYGYLNDYMRTTIRLLKDVTDNVIIPAGRYINLDLNGHVLASDNGVSTIYNKGNLMLSDSAPATLHYFSYVKGGAWTLADNADATAKAEAKTIGQISASTADGTLIKVNGGVITGTLRSGSETQFAGIYNESGSKLKVYDGVNVMGFKVQHSAIYNVHAALNVNKANIVGNTAYSGAGIKNYNGTATIGDTLPGCSNADVLIAYNTTTSNGEYGDGGGGVYNILAPRTSTFTPAENTSTETVANLTVNHATIINNNSAYKGGGISNAIDKEGTASVTINDGIISGNESVHNGGGIANYTHNSNGIATVTVNGGTISGNKALIRDYNLLQQTASGGNGGGIANTGILTISGSTTVISGNESVLGGGIYNSGTLNLTNGSVKTNKAVIITKQATVTIPAQYVAAVAAKEGLFGGVYNDNGTFTMTGGEITGNTAENNIGGVFNEGDAMFTVGGTAKISDNTVLSAASNLVLPYGKTISAATGANAPAAGMSVGVTLLNAAMNGTTTGTITTANSSDYSSYFTSDDTSYIVYNDTTASNALKLGVAPVFDDRFGGTVTKSNYSTIYTENAVPTTPCPAKTAGYTFAGWYTGVDGTGSKLSGTPVPGTTYYAKWAKTINAATFTVWTSDDSMPAAGGNYLLSKDMNQSSWAVPANTKLALNGHKISKNFSNYNNLTIVICDESDLSKAQNMLATGNDDVTYHWLIGQDMTVTGYTMIKKKGVKLDIDGNGKTITASKTEQGDAVPYVFDIWSHRSNETYVTMKNLTLKVKDGFKDAIVVQTEANKKVMPLTLDGVSIIMEQENAPVIGGKAKTCAPLIANHSDVTLKGNVNITTDKYCWAAIGLDSKEGNASLSFDTAAIVTFTDNRTDSQKAKDPLIKFDNHSNNSEYPDGYTTTATVDNKLLPVGNTGYNPKVTITFRTNGGTTVEPVYAAQYWHVEKPAAPTKTNYTFGGWYQNSSLSVAWNFGDDVVSENTTLYAKWIKNAESKAVINGTIVNDAVPSAPVADAIVELWLGTVKVAATTTDSNGAYSFGNVENGTFNIVVKDGEKTKTALVSISTADTYTIPAIEMPSKDVSSKVELTNLEAAAITNKSDLTKATVGGVDEIAAEYEATAQSTDKIVVVLTVEPKAENTSDTEQESIKQEAGSKSIEFIDLSLTMQKNGAAAENIGNSNTKLLTVNIPFDTTGVVASSITVYRYHSSSVDTLTTTPNANGEKIEVGGGVLTIYAKKFSTYAIGYTKEVASVGGSVSSYAISGKDTENGKLTLSTKKASAGETVTITVTPDEGCKLDKLTLTDKNGNSVAMTKVNETTYTFKMPSSDVTVSAIFTKTDKCPQDATCVYAKYTDANPMAWYHNGVHYCVEYGYMKGVDNGLFAPNGTLSRAMIVTMLWRMEGSPVVNYAMSFKDVPADFWYTEAIRWAQSTGVVLGYDETSFGPEDNVTREQLAAILWRYAKLKGYDVSVGEDTNILSYDDAIGGISEYAIPAMQWACGAGIINGIGNKLEARGFATRAQAACMIQRFCVNVK